MNENFKLSIKPVDHFTNWCFIQYRQNIIAFNVYKLTRKYNELAISDGEFFPIELLFTLESWAKMTYLNVYFNQPAIVFDNLDRYRIG